MQATKYAGRPRVPRSWGNPVATYLGGGTARMVYRLDNSATMLLDPEASMRLRMLPAEGTPLPSRRVLPLVSADPAADVDPLRAASSLAGHGDWHPRFLHYDLVADHVQMTVTEEPAAGGPAVPVTKSLSVTDVAEQIRGIDGGAAIRSCWSSRAPPGCVPAARNPSAPGRAGSSAWT